MKLVVYILIAIALIVLLIQYEPEGRVYDCRDAHWHPDYPIEVKQECARLRIEEWHRQHQETQLQERYI